MSSQTQQTGPLSDWNVSVVVEWAIGTAVSYLFYGANIVISFTVIYLLITTSTRMTRGRLGLLFLTIFMLLVSTLSVSLNTAYIFIQIPLFTINPPDIIDIDSLITSIGIVVLYVDRLNFIACDGIAVWRAWILYPHNLAAKIVLILCMIGSLAGSFVSAGLETEESLQDIAAKQWGIFEWVLPLLITNLVSTSMIAYKTWYYQRDVRQNLISTNGSVMKIQKIMWFLVESGFFYCISWIGYTLIRILKETSSAGISRISAVTMPMLSAIYPLLVVLIAAHEKSKEASNSGMSLIQSIKFASKNSTEPEIQG
ncbi:hypothetical protein K435DRAFT_861484 [Dendrothele bispora CBS 962.96]|uniref:Fungal pheromone STE3G-protein-coupled receptor n=1 Tax=Dendrothele bispora (strain CBS 962.96) TaxID=1314807 RepID=A0A4V4HF37_DENBC|nr:hypothetical protein K435DRAFT_861484 [Dendrothele bispora CBS 962.96]